MKNLHGPRGERDAERERESNYRAALLRGTSIALAVVAVAAFALPPVCPCLCVCCVCVPLAKMTWLSLWGKVEGWGGRAGCGCVAVLSPTRAVSAPQVLSLPRHPEPEREPEMTMTPLDFCSDFCKSFLCVSVAFSSSAKATNLPPSGQGRASMTTKQKQTNTKTTEQHKQRRQRQHLLQVGEGVASGKGEG